MDKPCPRCKAIGRFGSRRRQVGDDKYEIFIKCKFCNWEYVVISGSSSKIQLQRDITRLKERVKNDPSLQGLLERKIAKYMAEE